MNPSLGQYNIEYSLAVENGWEGQGNVNADPLFCNAGNNDFTLYDNSPCLGTGENGSNMGAFDIGCSAIDGCTDPYAGNYNEDATIDDGSCTDYPNNGEYALNFEGQDNIAIPSSTSIDQISSSLTLIAWINPNQYPSGYNPRIFDRNEGSGGGNDRWNFFLE